MTFIQTSRPAAAATIAADGLDQHSRQTHAVQNGERQLSSHGHLVFPNLLDALRSLLKLIVVALFILTFIMQPFRIPSESMEPTLLVGDFLLVNKTVFGPAGFWKWLLPYQPVHRDDIVVFHFPLNPEEPLVKRVVAVPGDRTDLVDGVLDLNGRKQNEPFAIYEDTGDSGEDTFQNQFPSASYTDPGVDAHWWNQMQHLTQTGKLVVPKDSYFVLGDNRNHSRDSRYWGFVPRVNIIGQPFIIYFSLREPSSAKASWLVDDKLGHGNDPLSRVLDFARWHRILHVIR